MKQSTRFAAFLCSLFLTLTLLSGCGYNEIQTMDEQVDNNWAQIESQLQRRSDLIPNLAKVVQSYAKHERTVFKDIADARARMSGALQSNDPRQAAQASGEMNSALSRLLVVAENYPQLRANEQYTRLMDELAGTENRIAVARMDYNNSVRDYNAYIRRFPTNLTAIAVNAEKREYYNPPAASQTAPELNMDENQ
jgi:LemA protein